MSQKQIARAIGEAEADYVLALKGNQGTLHGEVQSFPEDAQASGFTGIAHDFLEATAQGHGRRETRRYWISEDIEWLTVC